MTKILSSFHGSESTKQKYVARVDAHIAADHLVRGTGWEDGKGCAVGCTLENYDHRQYEVELGIPEWLARLEDTLFEGMSEEKSRNWPADFLRAIPVGVDLEKSRTPVLIMLLEHSLTSIRAVQYDPVKFPTVKAAIDETEAAVEKTIRYHKESAARSAARSAAESARSAACDYYADRVLEIIGGLPETEED